MTGTTGGMYDTDDGVEYWLSAHLVAFVYGVPMEVMVHASASCMVRAWIDGDGDLLVNCNDMVALMGQPRYHQWS